MWHFTSGLPETRCGAGSTILNTQSIRARLPELFLEYGVKSIIDLPCGDFNWMAQTDLSGIDYTGYDNDSQNIIIARGRDSKRGFEPRSKKLVMIDVLCGTIGTADLVICRDFLQHLPFAEAEPFMDKLRSVAPLALITSHLNQANSDISLPGDFRPLNLQVSPFSLDPPIEIINDCGRILGVWRQ